ncbi:MAG: peptidylprolyl isomerase [Pseudomonadales bacterium]
MLHLKEKMPGPRYYKFDYVIRNAQGEVVDTSDGGVPLWFVEGDGRLMPGLERALTDTDTGDEFDVVIEPADAYGWPQRSLIRTISKDMIDANVEEIEPGMIFQVGSGATTEVVKVVAIEDDGITIDGNHPLAGITFHFSIKVLEARPATDEELALQSSSPT